MLQVHYNLNIWLSTLFLPSVEPEKGFFHCQPLLGVFGVQWRICWCCNWQILSILDCYTGAFYFIVVFRVFIWRKCIIMNNKSLQWWKCMLSSFFCRLNHMAAAPITGIVSNWIKPDTCYAFSKIFRYFIL